MTDFRMSALKPLLPDWLYAGWSRIAQDPGMVIRGWDSCGLRCMFDERREETVRNAKRAIWDESHELYPLFPNNDHTELPPETVAGIAEPDMEPLCILGDTGDCDQQLRALVSEGAATVAVVQRVLGDIAAPPTAPQQAVPTSVAGRRQSLYPIFAAARRHVAAASMGGA